MQCYYTIISYSYRQLFFFFALRKSVPRLPTGSRFGRTNHFISEVGNIENTSRLGYLKRFSAVDRVNQERKVFKKALKSIDSLLYARKVRGSLNFPPVA